MKPYKFIKGSLPTTTKETFVRGCAQPKKIPLWFFKNVHTPPSITEGFSEVHDLNLSDNSQPE